MNQPTPVTVPGLSNVVAVSAGSHHTLVLLQDGTVRTWGDGAYGQMGDGTRTDRLSPVSVAGLSGVTAIAAGAYHSVVLLSDGTLVFWGHNPFGQKGDGTVGTDALFPSPVPGLSGVVSLATGDHHILAVLADGTVRAWGENDYGQVGNGTFSHQSTPVLVSGLSGIQSVGGGVWHSVALRSDGSLLAWGRNNFGQLGDGTTVNRAIPVLVQSNAGPVAVIAGGYHSAALYDPSPATPSAAGQFKTDASTAITVGGATGETIVVLKATVGDPDGDTTKLQTEIRPVGTAFTNSITHAGSFFASGTVASVTASGLTDGSYHWQFRAVDANGATSPFASFGGNAESAADFVVDTTAPAAPAITSPANGTLTNDNTPTLIGTAEASATVEIFDGSTSLGTTVADGSGNWSFTTPALSDGAHNFTARAIDAAGNTGAASTAVSITIDATAPFITTTSLPDGTVGVVYAQNLAATDTGGSVTWSVVSGSLPDGLTLSSSGSISGTPAAAGTFTFTVRATDAAGNTVDRALSITIGLPADPSVTSLGASPGSGQSPLPVSFTGEATGGAALVSALWEFGDGARFLADSVTGLSHTYEIPGTYTVTLTVTDSLGRTASRTTTVTVTAPPKAPSASVSATPTSGAAPLSVSFTGTATTPTGSFIGYEWDFDGDGVVDASSPTSKTASFVYTVPGTYTAMFKAVRDDGTAAAASVEIVVGVPAGTPPGLTGPTATPNPAGLFVSVAFSATGTVGAGATGTVVRYEWDFDADGRPDRIVNGTSGVADTPSFTYRAPGTYAVKVRVTDLQADGSPRLATDGTVSVTVSPPLGIRVWIVKPRQENGVAKISGNYYPVNVNAVPAADVDFSTAEVQYRRVGDVAFTTAALAGRQAAPPAVLYYWDLSTVTPGIYEFRARIRDRFGTLYSSDDAGQRGLVTVEVTAPVLRHRSGGSFKADPAGGEPYFTPEPGVVAGDTSTNVTDGLVLLDEAFDGGEGVEALKVGGQSVAVRVPPGALPLGLQIVTIGEYAGNPGVHTGFADLTYHGIELDGDPVPQRPVEVEFTYPDDDGNGIVDGTRTLTEDLQILHYESSLARWIPLPGQTHDREGRRIVARTFSLSPFVLSGSGVPVHSSGGGGCYLASGGPGPAWPIVVGITALGALFLRKKRKA